MEKPRCSFSKVWKLFPATFLLLGAAHGAIDYTFTTLAGQLGTNGSANGSGTLAQFNQPGGVVVASNGTVYVADSANNTIRAITSAGVVTTLAGSAGASGTNDGTGAAARFSFPQGLVLDGSGNLFVADTGNSTIRKITASGVVTTVAGSAGITGTNDGTGLAAQFCNPFAVTVDSSGNVFVADTGNHTIRRITPAGVVTTLAGQPGTSGLTDGPGELARFYSPSGIVIDGAGNLFVADKDNDVIRVIDTGANVDTFAGSAEPGHLDGIGTAASFSQPYGLGIDGVGNLYVADAGNSSLRRVSPAAEVSTSANSTNLVGGLAPQAVAVDPSGNLFVADAGTNHVIRRGALTGGALILAQPNNLAGGSVSGSGLFPLSSNVQLTATAATNWIFAGWNDGDGHATRTITVVSNSTYIASFSPLSLVTVLANPPNAGSVTGGGTYPAGSNVQLTATASNNWLFVNWNDGSTSTPRTITVPATNITYTATFAAAATITVAASTNAGGSVTGSGTFFLGSNALLTATASNDWCFLGWNDGVTNSSRTIVVASNMMYTAVFAPTALISVQANPASGGSVSGGGTYVVGSNALITATASNSWRFLSWNDANTNASRSVLVGAGGATYTATFGQLSAVELIKVPTNGGNVSGAGIYIVGSNATITALASNGWLFTSWNGTTTNNPWTFSVPSSALVCTAYFAKLSVVTAVASPTNAGSVIGGGTYIAGSNATLTTTASNNWAFIGWSGGSTNNPLTIVVPATNITYTASFAAIATISAVANTNEGGSVTGGGTFFVGSNALLTATASNGWQFIRWSDGNTNSPRSIVVSSNMNYTAVFAPTALITVLANPASGGSVTGGGTYVVGSNALLAAAASNAWRFLSWNDGSTNASRSILVATGGATYTATFGQLGTVNIVCAPTNGGSATGAGQYLVGSNATLTALASNSWLFTGWNGTSTNNPLIFSVTSGVTICTANFARLSVVTVVASPTNGGTVVGGGSYLSGSNVQLSATPTSNWAFGAWNDGNTNATRSITVPATNITYMATFNPPATITVRASPLSGGSISGGGTFLPGSNITLRATPAAGWGFMGWTDGPTNNPRSITVPVGGATYTARFGSTAGIGMAVEATNLTWVLGGSAAWAGQSAITHGTASAAQSGAITVGQQTYFQTTTNGPMSLLFWWKVSSAAANPLQFYIGTQLVSQISGNVDWNQYITYIGTSNQVTLTWVYSKTSTAVSGSDAGWVDQITWLPCPYARNVPQLFFQEPTGTIASWVVGANGSFQFARLLANTGGWALKAAGDIDGDGVSDLLFQNTASDTGGWFLNPDGSVRDARFWFNIGGWEIKAAGDYEGIGRAQLLFQNAGGTAAYWRLDTNGAFVSSVVLGNVPGWKLRGAGDLDGDHKAELFWQNAAGQVTIWYHNPDGSIRGVLAFSTGEWALSGVADVDNDGVCDLIWQTPDTRTGGWFMQTNGTARSASFWWPTGGWKLKAAGR